MLTPEMMEELRQESLAFAKLLRETNPCRAGIKNNCVHFEWDCCYFYSCEFSPAKKWMGVPHGE